MEKDTVFSVQYWLKKPMIRFAGVGILSTIIDVSLLNLLRFMGVEIYLATGLGFLGGSTNGYLLNSRVVFGQNHTYKQYLKYVLVASVGLLITEFIIGWLHVRSNLLGLNSAKLVAVVIVYFWNYGMSKFWTFR